MGNPVILSYAILTVNWDEKGTDYLDNFVPIVAECIRQSGVDIVSVQEVQDTLKSKFKWHIPKNALIAIFRRLAKKKYLTVQNHAYIRNNKKLDSLNFHSIQQQVLSMHDSLIGHLIKFSKERFEIHWNEEEAENALHAYLEEFQITLSNFNSSSSIIPPPDEIVKGAKYIVGTFIKHLEETASPDFEFLVTISKGNLLANAIYLTEPSKTSKKIRNTDFYFDTTFLVFALGYAGKPRKEPCTELLELLYKAGANLKCFKHTLEEMRGVLDACAHRLRSGMLRDAYGPSIEYFLSLGLKPSDVELFIINLENDLRSIRVQVVDKPKYINEDHVIDEHGLTLELIQNIQYHSDQALQRDVDSVSAIMRVRQSREVYEVEDCGAIFVTTNNALVKISRDFFYKEAPLGAIPPCIPDYVLTNLLWLKTPLGAPDLPRKRVIADCYAATQPDDRMWRKYLAAIEKNESENKITVDDFVLLRYAIEAKSALMDITLGEEIVFTQGTISEILSLTREKIQQEKDLEILEEKNKRKFAEDELDKIKLEKLQRQQRIQGRSQNYASWITQILEYGILLLLFIGILYTFPWDLPSPINNWVKYLVSTLQLLILVISVANIYFGTTIKSWVRRFEVFLTHKIQIFLE